MEKSSFALAMAKEVNKSSQKEGFRLVVEKVKAEIKSLAVDQIEFIIKLPYEVKMVLKLSLLELKQIKDKIVDHVAVWTENCKKFCKNNPSLKTYLELLKDMLFDLKTRLFKPDVLEKLPALLIPT